MQTHTLIGGAVIRKTVMLWGSNTFLRLAKEIAEPHHECWGGSSYPHGLEGEAIPLCARLMAVADIYEALTSERPYKPAFSHERAFAIITMGDDRTRPEHFSPRILKAFRAVQPEWASIPADFFT